MNTTYANSLNLYRAEVKVRLFATNVYNTPRFCEMRRKKKKMKKERIELKEKESKKKYAQYNRIFFIPFFFGALNPISSHRIEGKKKEEKKT